MRWRSGRIGSLFLAGKLPQVGGAKGAKMKNPPRQRGGGLKNSV
jgi:hypothetical protein